MLHKIDDQAIDFVSFCYHYPWDRWGITLGNAGSGLSLISIGIRGIDGMWDLFFAFVGLAMFQWLHILQKRDLKQINGLTLSIRDSVFLKAFRWMIFSLNVASCLKSASNNDIWGVVDLPITFFTLFIICIQVRERDPDRFKQVKYAHAQ